jgi:hypothetical protein
MIIGGYTAFSSFEYVLQGYAAVWLGGALTAHR